MDKKVLIVGAGLSGAAAARSLAESGFKVRVIERGGDLGGTASDHSCYDYFFQHHGPHIFHTNIKRVYDFLSRFTEWFPYRHTVRAQVREPDLGEATWEGETFPNGKYIPVPFNFTSLEAMYPQERADALKRSLTAAYGKDANVPISELLKSGDREIAEFAEFVYKTVFKFYSAKQWGMDMAKIDPGVLSRVPVRCGYADGYFSDVYQAQPLKGYSEMVRQMLLHENILIETGVDAKDVLEIRGGLLYADGEAVDYPVIYTGRIDELFGYAQGVLAYRSLRFVEDLKKSVSYQPCAVANFTVSEQFTRISEFKKFTAPSSKSETTVIMYEYPRECQKGMTPYYPLPTAEARARYEKYRVLAQSVTHLYPLGRLGKYVYINMDRAVDDALTLAEEICAAYCR